MWANSVDFSSSRLQFYRDIKVVYCCNDGNKIARKSFLCVWTRGCITVFERDLREKRYKVDLGFYAKKKKKRKRTFLLSSVSTIHLRLRGFKENWGFVLWESKSPIVAF